MATVPAELELVLDFLNTRELGAGTDVLTGEWLVAHGLGDDADVEAARAFRERLRAVLSGEPVSLDATLTVRLEPAGPRLEGSDAVSRVLAVIAASTSWDRVKVCSAEDCRWAFFDTSRNHSRTWCSMSDCGNRAKARAYRARQSPNAGA
ncbi:CGNR zinc finger domain-containing protein [Solirubrobacter soli]|uniref:CGNR zinc finger domain-containing protein n=1 Tax=Solirubrobacter soli TaxID=363832 RepID=UPI00056884E1|nr:CGNR zinc finger domain-containing protein [Solirubrobacter soli]